ncbi:MAG TPA: hypothetical protein VK923_01855 [Euzebyales bacterium]|nr:hypothetical protein [Euzebyales bacterium]
MAARRTTRSSPLMRELDLDCCIACGQVCEITGTFHLPGQGGVEPYVRTRCVAGHVLVGPAFALRTTVD